ncbi:hypothetical protein [Methylobacterium longum]|uniref:Uncharacterized protein n=1 Tax=Methylobacterium longum TaxID=767694 RepID=A0ABT8APG3_9HYPH|nr:hypothetical protein [Methylobacterium longum]MDN3571794.1 hypothetical protein [Methylobacterium longum]GJE13995.1 hypothetical protein FOHLNKBM_5064 [Methylobacterium longum]
MTRVIPAALALACVGSPAMAAAPTDLHYAFTSGIFVLTLGCAALALLLSVVWRLPALGIVAALCLAIVAVGFGLTPALAQDAAAKPGVVIPWGQWIVDYGPQFALLFATWIAGIVTWALGKWAPWSTSVLTQQRIEQAAQALAQYGVKAVAGSVKDGKVTVNAGPAVIQAAVQRGVNVLPKKVIDAMIKGGGMSSIIFRVLDLEESADEHKVLQPAITTLKASSDPKLAKAA